MPQGTGTYGSTVGRPKSLLPKRIVANPATAEEIKTTNRNAKMITTLLLGAAVPLPFRMLGNAGKGFLSGMGFKTISQAFKKAGSLNKNVRSANTTSSKALQDATLKDFGMKNLSKGFHAKTGVTPRKRVDKHNTASHNSEDGFMPNFGAEGGTSIGSLLKYRKDMGIVEGTIKAPNLGNIPSSAKGNLLFNNKAIKSHIDAMNKASRKKPK